MIERIMPKLNDRRIYFSFATGILAIVAVVLSAVWMINQFMDNTQQLFHTEQVLNNINSTESNFRDIDEAFQRYLITGDRKYAAAERQSEIDLKKTMHRLTVLTEKSAQQAERMQKVRSIIEDRLQKIDVVLKARRPPKFQSVRARLLDRFEMTAEARQSLAEMRDLEQQVLTRRNDQLSKRADWIRYINIFGGFAALALIAMAALTTNRQMRHRQEMRDVFEAQSNLLNNVLKSTSEAIIAADQQGSIFVFNTAARELMALSEDPKNIKEWLESSEFLRSDESRCTLSELPLGRALVGEDTNDAQNILKRRDGQIFHLAVSGRPLRDLAGNISGAVVALRDITQRRQHEEDISALNRTLSTRNFQLESMNKELESFSYSVSHDLRAPLRSMTGFSEMLMEDHAAALDATAQDLLRRISNAAKRMGQLIDGLLSLSRLSRSPMSIIEVNLSEYAQTILSTLKESDPTRKVEVQIEDGIITTGDSQLIEVALTNLLNNAWKFTSKNSSAVIEFGQTMKDKRSVFYVKDNGAGFDMKYAQKLFGAFQRLHGPDEFEGTGIGLATVQRVIRRHGGTIWADSSPGRGTTFYFNFNEHIELKEGDFVEQNHFTG